jgi:methyltransferase (TIGR00027 family)
MAMPESLIRNISDTARWAAVYRARETERPDALFRDPFARRLAGERGEEIANTIKFSTKNTWSWIARTYLFDNFLLDQLKQGCDMVINLAAGLDSRPYRMDLPSSLKWIEVDLPEILDYKQESLASEAPTCSLERIALDLSNVAARRELFDQLGRRSEKAVILSEGLLVYFTPEEAGAFAADLKTPASFHRWILDLASPGLLQLLRKNMAKDMGAAAVLKFGPAEGPSFFQAYGWNPIAVRSLLKTAGRLKRLPLFMKLMAPLTPEVPNPKQSQRPWGGVCVLEKAAA